MRIARAAARGLEKSVFRRRRFRWHIYVRTEVITRFGHPRRSEVGSFRKFSFGPGRFLEQLFYFFGFAFFPIDNQMSILLGGMYILDYRFQRKRNREQ